MDKDFHYNQTLGEISKLKKEKIRLCGIGKVGNTFEYRKSFIFLIF